MLSNKETKILINTIEILNEKALSSIKDEDKLLLYLETAANISRILADN